MNDTSGRPKPEHVDCTPSSCKSRDIVSGQANTRATNRREELEQMARRRFQNPAPERRGEWWTLRVWKTTFVYDRFIRIRERVRLAKANMNVPRYNNSQPSISGRLTRGSRTLVQLQISSTTLRTSICRM